MKAYRHGDVVIIPVERRGRRVVQDAGSVGGAEMEETGALTLAEGEITGHSHRLTAEEAIEFMALDNLKTDFKWRRDFGSKNPLTGRRAGDDDLSIQDLSENNGRFFRVKSSARLSHEEHDEITLPPGEYISYNQREYWGGPERTGSRMVYD